VATLALTGRNAQELAKASTFSVLLNVRKMVGKSTRKLMDAGKRNDLYGESVCIPCMYMYEVVVFE